MLATTTTHTSMMSARRASLVSSRATHGAQRAPARAIVRKAIVSEDVDVGKTGAAYTEFASLLDKYQYNYKVGDVISGKIKACDAKGAWVEIGAKSEALCPTSEASLGNVRNVSIHSFYSSKRARAGAIASYRSERRRRDGHGIKPRAFVLGRRARERRRRSGANEREIATIPGNARLTNHARDAFLCKRRLRRCSTSIANTTLKSFRTTTARAA